MLLKAITIENFKGIREPVRVELKPVTLLFGANSAGKSTVVQALHFAQEIFERHNVDPGKTLIGGEAIKLGGFETLVHGRDPSRPIVLRVELDLTQTELPVYRLPYVTSYAEIEFAPEQEIVSGWIEIKVAWSSILERPFLAEYAVGLNDHPFAIVRSSADLKQINVNILDVNHPAFGKDVQSELDVDDPFADLLPSGTWRSNLLMLGAEVLKSPYIGPFDMTFGVQGQADAMPVFGQPLDIQPEVFQEDAESPMEREFVEGLSRYLVGLGEVARDALRSFRYVGPLREVPPRNFDPERSPDESRWAHGLAAWDVLAKADPAFIDRVNAWLESDQRINSGYRVELKRYKELDVESPLFATLNAGWTLDEELPLEAQLRKLPTRTRLLLREIAKNLEVEPQDVGVGISQLLPVIVAALYTQAAVVAIEQPELHIHPAWQVVLGDLVLEQAKQKDVLFLVETHSEHLVLRIMRRMRETFADTLPPGAPAATPEDVALLFVEADDGRTLVRNMPLNEAGELVKAWPGGFFEERLSELF